MSIRLDVGLPLELAALIEFSTIRSMNDVANLSLILSKYLTYSHLFTDFASSDCFSTSSEKERLVIHSQ